MLIQMCQSIGATHYLSNEGSRSYVDEFLMSTHRIQHCWQNFNHPIYTQGNVFIPNISAIDILFNLGPKAGELVRNSGSINIETVIDL